MSTLGGRTLKRIFNCLRNTNNSIQLSHARPTMHRIYLVSMHLCTFNVAAIFFRGHPYTYGVLLYAMIVFLKWMGFK